MIGAVVLKKHVIIVLRCLPNEVSSEVGLVILMKRIFHEAFFLPRLFLWNFQMLLRNWLLHHVRVYNLQSSLKVVSLIRYHVVHGELLLLH